MKIERKKIMKLHPWN